VLLCTALGAVATPVVNWASVTITGGSITGITDLAVADGGTGASTLTGLVKGNGTSAFSAAAAGTDYVAPDVELTALAGTTSAANTLPRYTGSGTADTIAFAEGTSSPTATGVTNVGTVSASTLHYVRVGNAVHCWGEVTLDAVTTTDTTFRVSLPIASNLANSHELSGTWVSQIVTGERAGEIHGDVTNDAALFHAVVISTASNVWTYEFSYTVL
jgi:hypothetical protein